MGSMTLGGPQSAIGALWDGFVDMAGDMLGTSGFSHEQKIWRRMANYDLKRDLYNANTSLFDMRNTVVTSGHDADGHSCDFTLGDVKGKVPDGMKTEVASKMMKTGQMLRLDLKFNT